MDWQMLIWMILLRRITKKKLVTLTTVRPQARFGELTLNGNVVEFKEKPQTSIGWINGGYLVVEPEFIELIQGDDTVIEQEPLERVAELGQLNAFKHHGFWQCMDQSETEIYLKNLGKCKLPMALGKSV